MPVTSFNYTSKHIGYLINQSCACLYLASQMLDRLIVCINIILHAVRNNRSADSLMIFNRNWHILFSHTKSLNATEFLAIKQFVINRPYYDDIPDIQKLATSELYSPLFIIQQVHKAKILNTIIHVVIIHKVTDQITRYMPSNHRPQNSIIRELELFCTTIAHEIRNPLSIIKGFLSLLQKTDTDRPQQQYIKHMHTGLRNIEFLLDNLLYKHNTAISQLSVTNVPSLVSDIAKAYAAAPSTKKISWTIDIEDQDMIILADISDIACCVHNLIRNAIDAIDDTGSVIIKCYNRSSYIYIHIEDSGPGISQRIVKNIFHHPRITTKKKGNGLGLFRVYNIVKENNGDIIYDRINNQTVFIIIFPGRP